MKIIIVLSCLFALAVAKPGYLAAPLFYQQPLLANSAFSYSTVYAHQAAPSIEIKSAPIAPISPITAKTDLITPVIATAPLLSAIEKTQYHSQDELGQAFYGHSEAFQQHNAIQDAAGNKIGSYSYVAPDGQVIATNYIADALGYRVIPDNVPVVPAEIPIAPAETPEVIAARALHLKAHEDIKHRSRRSLLYTAPALTYAAPLQYSFPILSARPATLTTIVNNPGHAISYRIE